MDDKITIKIKYQGDNVYEFSISPSSTVLDLKKMIAEKTNVQAANQKVIFKGKILKDADTLSTYKVEGGSTMHMVQSNLGNTTTSSSDVKQETTTTSSNTSGGSSNTQQQQSQNLGGFGGFGNLGGFGNFGGFGGGGNLGGQNLNQVMSDPNFQTMMQNLFSDPQALQNIISSNPMLSSMVQNNPQIAQMLSDPQTLQMMMDPQVIQASMQMMQNMGGNNPFSMFGGGGFGNQGGSSNNQSSNQQSSSNESSGGSSNQSNPFSDPNFMSNLQNMMGGNQGFDENMFGGFGNFGGNQQQQNTSNTNVNYEEKYKTQLEQMEVMGFTNKETNLEALKATGGNVEAAIERLFTMIGK
jgi:ubiquilin